MAKQKKVGRPTKLKKSFYEQAFKLCLLGAKDEELAEFFHVSTTTISNWKETDPKFLEALNTGKAQADANVSNSLYKRAIGYDCPDTHFSAYEGRVTATPYRKHYPPDPTSCIFWLKNRQSAKWRDQYRVETPAIVPAGSEDQMQELARRVAFVLTSANRQTHDQPESRQ